MLVTDKYIFVHYPKTGGTFVSKVLEEYHKREKQNVCRLLIGNTVPNTNETYGQHGGINEIPLGLTNGRIVVSTIRNPYDLYVSQYEFKWWQKYPIIEPEAIRTHFPQFPDLTFPEYLKLRNTLFQNRLFEKSHLKTDLGANTLQFIRFFFRSPLLVLSHLNGESIESGDFKMFMYNISFLRTENLNENLYNFLLSLGELPEKVNYILHHKRVYPVEGGRSTSKPWKEYYNEDTKAYVRKMEGLLFKLFPEYDI